MLSVNLVRDDPDPSTGKKLDLKDLHEVSWGSRMGKGHRLHFSVLISSAISLPVDL